MLTVEVIEETAMDAQTDRSIRDALVVCGLSGGESAVETRAWHGSCPAYSLVLKDNERIAAHVGVVERSIRVGEQSLDAVGVQNVFVLPGYRKQRLADRLLYSLADQARQRGADVGLLFCLPVLEKVYSACGWRSLGFPDVMAIHYQTGQPYPLDRKNIAMYLPVRVEDFPAGEIHLNGDDW